MKKIVPCVYIVTNKTNHVLYVGVTNNLLRRIYEHREKQIKVGSRLKKMMLVEKFNSDWKDLYSTLI